MNFDKITGSGAFSRAKEKFYSIMDEGEGSFAQRYQSFINAERNFDFTNKEILQISAENVHRFLSRNESKIALTGYLGFIALSKGEPLRTEMSDGSALKRFNNYRDTFNGKLRDI